MFTLPHNTIVYLYKEAIQWTVIGFKPVALKWTVDSEQWTVRSSHAFGVLYYSFR
jgi:hypothetical protein